MSLQGSRKEIGMCAYCNDSFDDYILLVSGTKDANCPDDVETVSVELYFDTKEIILKWVKGLDDTIDFNGIDIEYCPMCGRKL